jgi:sarcosine oxidase subunit alpha
MAGQDANTLVQLPNAPNSLADTVPAVPGQTVKAQNYTGSFKYDLQAFTGLFSRFLPVGFYYRAFFRPRGIWEYWAKFIRTQAGLGVLNQEYRPDYFDKQYKFAQVAVVGGGPAGLSVALAAANNGADVILIEENAILGGSLNYARFAVDNKATQVLRDDLIAQVESHENITVMCNTSCNSWHSDNWLALVSSNKLYKLRAEQVVICSGSLEQQSVFRGNRDASR